MPAKPRFIDLHVLQTVPYANLNRDDLNSPKTLIYGGAERTRVSSQCWKRAVRLVVEDELADRALRTRQIPAAVADALRDRGWPDDLAAHAGQQIVLSAAKSGDGLKLEDAGHTSVLLYLPESSVGALADLAADHREEIAASLATGKKKPAAVLPQNRVSEVLSARNGIISLFGRMLAELPAANVDGAVQVAHAFTTHATEAEVDFFTAVDDCNPDDVVASGHMNTGEFSAGVFYRYATVDIADLVNNLGDDHTQAMELAGAFLRAFLTSMPEAKKTATAPYTVPDLAYVAVRCDRPVSLAGAFEAPVRPAAEGGWGDPSRRRLDEHAGRVHRLLGSRGLINAGHAGLDDKPLGALGERHDSFDALVDSALRSAWRGGNGVD